MRARRLALLVGVAACRHHEPADGVAPRPPEHEREIAALRAFEDQRRAATDFAALPPSDVALGPDPYRIAAVSGGRFVGLLRGESAVVLLDDHAAELARLPAPRTPGGLAVAGDDVFVVGEYARELAHYRAADSGSSGGAGAAPLARVATLTVDALGMRDIALAPDGRTAYIVEEPTGRLLAVSLDRRAERVDRQGGGLRELARCHGPVHVQALAGVVAVNCLIDHAIELHRGGDVARIHHDGPIWGFALHREADGSVVIATGGVEDHPLEREDGGFGYIDSYVTLYRLGADAAQPVQLAQVNTSALGVVTPKWLAIRAADDALSVAVTGYASATMATLTWRGGDFTSAPEVVQAPVLPGTNDARPGAGGALVIANPLLDGWVVAGPEPRLVEVTGARPPRAVLSRIGELLFFTTMMAPWNSSEGKLSRFTCETCHHEGYVDGRTHYTGRDTVHATTRPLYGLFNNRPHFSRALDKTMTQMVHAEFRVANRHNGRDPWFALSRADVPWLDRVPGAPAELPAELLREAFMSFLMDFTHRANPAAQDHAQFTPLERAGAEAFRDRCSRCHAARLVADEPGSLVPFERWESLVLSPAGPIVWSNAAYEQTHVEPYVHPSGARVPALRRLYKKWPYFTNGKARSLDDLLDRFATGPTTTYHDAAPDGADRLGEDDKRALRAFLDLL